MITIHKLDHENRETWIYTGEIIQRGPNWICIQAYFDRDDHDGRYVNWRRGDRFLEWFYSDRWYNIFEMHDKQDDHIKGWYCNVTRPAIINTDSISWSDLALDLWVYPSGETLLLDEDELAGLTIDEATRNQVWQALADLRATLDRRDPPFQAIPPRQDGEASQRT